MNPTPTPTLDDLASLPKVDLDLFDVLDDLASLPKVDLDLHAVLVNAFAVMGAIRRAGKRAGWTAEQVDQWTDVAASGDYDHLIASALAVVA